MGAKKEPSVVFELGFGCCGETRDWGSRDLPGLGVANFQGLWGGGRWHNHDSKWKRNVLLGLDLPFGGVIVLPPLQKWGMVADGAGDERVVCAEYMTPVRYVRTMRTSSCVTSVGALLLVSKGRPLTPTRLTHFGA